MCEGNDGSLSPLPCGFRVEPLVLGGGLVRFGFSPELGVEADQFPSVDQRALTVGAVGFSVERQLFGGYRFGNIMVPRSDKQLRFDPFQAAHHFVDRVAVPMDQVAENRYHIGVQIVDDVDRPAKPVERRTHSLFAESELRVAILYQAERFQFRSRGRRHLIGRNGVEPDRAQNGQAERFHKVSASKHDIPFLDEHNDCRKGCEKARLPPQHFPLHFYFLPKAAVNRFGMFTMALCGRGGGAKKGEGARQFRRRRLVFFPSMVLKSKLGVSLGGLSVAK